MRNLMIGAVSAVLLMSGAAMAQTSTSPSISTYPDATTSPSAGSTSGGTGTMVPGTSGSSGGALGGSSSGSSTTAPGTMPGMTTAPSGMGNNTSSNPARDNQTGGGTHCPPGTPNCGPKSN